jgi:hypothetical protein
VRFSLGVRGRREIAQIGGAVCVPDLAGSGRGGGPTVTSGNLKIINYYSFTGDLDRATIFANIRVSPEGKGTFVSFAQGSTSRSQAYANAISQYLRNIQFDRSSDESMVVVRFIFNVKGD